MTAPTHAQTRYYLHVGREALDAVAQFELKTHLGACADCRRYVAELATLQSRLPHAMRAWWDQYRAPTDLASHIQARIGEKMTRRRILNFGGSLAAIGIVSVVIGALAWLIGVVGPGGQTAAELSPTASAPNSATPTGATSTPIAGLAVFGDVITLVDVDLAETRLLAGSTISLTLRWQTLAAAPTSYAVFVHLVDNAGNLVAQSNSIPAAYGRPGEVVEDTRQLALPDDLATGRYELMVGLYDTQSGERLPTQVGESAIRLEVIEVQGIPRRVGEVLGEFATLLGFDLVSDRLPPGGAVEMTLFWRAQTETTVSYMVSVQVFGDNKTLVAQADTVPGDGLHPTTAWRPGEVITDHYTLQLPADLPAGEYRIVMGMYDPVSGTRLSTALDNQSIVLTAVEVTLSPPALDAAAGWQTYTNIRYGYVIQFPPGFNITKGPGADLPDEAFQTVAGISFDGMSKPDDPNAGVSFGITTNLSDANGEQIACSDDQDCLDKWLAAAEWLTASRQLGAEIEQTAATILDRTVPGIQSTLINPLYTQTNRYYVVAVNGQAWQISITFNNYAAHEIDPLWAQILGAFRLLG